MKELYRRDYPGEYVITNITIRKGKRIETREWIDNPISVDHVSKRATCITYDPDVRETLYKRIEHNNGGNLGKMKMQTYGDETVWKKMVPDFMVSHNIPILEGMVKHGYTHHTVVYTSGSNCIKYPGEFYLFPYSISLQPAPATVWLACFDGHKEIFLVGFNDDDTKEKMILSLVEIMETYKDVNFIQVTNNSSPSEWKSMRNFSSMDVNTYVSHCDV